MSTKQDDSSFDPSQRRLCPDGSCVGLVGSDGKCKVCGALDPGRAGATLAADPNPQPESRGEPAGFAGGGPKGLENLPGFQSAIDAEVGQATASGAEAAFDPKRRLCLDETCIGVIGVDNKCSVCGRRG
jgi:hypothetical protein